MLIPQEQEKIFGSLLKRKENLYCAECGSKSPCWASLQFGVFVCLNCSGAHRALGPSVTRVKSIRLDTWNRDWLQNMQLGNTNINLYWEHLLSDDRKHKPNENSTIDMLIRYVKDKYIRKLYANPNYSSPQQVIKASKTPPKQSNAVNLPPKPQQHKKAKFHKTASMNVIGSSPSNGNKKMEADFSFFDKIVGANDVQEPKVQSNLISLQNDKKKGNAFFDDFQFSLAHEKPKEEKYNKQQFMSMGGIKPNKPKQEVKFDFFHPADKNAPPVKGQNLINFENEKSNNFHQTFNDYGATGPLHYNKNQFATMGGVYHPPKQDFQNMVYQKLHAPYPQAPKTNLYGFDSNWMSAPGPSMGLPPKCHPKPMRANNITLEANINLQSLGKEGKKGDTVIRSWADDWK